MLRASGLIVLAMLCAANARADVVATCGVSEGWGYYVPGGSSKLSAEAPAAINAATLMAISARFVFFVFCAATTSAQSEAFLPLERSSAETSSARPALA